MHSGETVRLKVAPRALHKAHLRLVLFRFALILVGLRAVRLVFCASCGVVAKSSMISMVRAVRLVPSPKGEALSASLGGDRGDRDLKNFESRYWEHLGRARERTSHTVGT